MELPPQPLPDHREIADPIITSGQLIALECGSHFREQLTIPGSIFQSASWQRGQANPRSLGHSDRIHSGWRDCRVAKSVAFDNNATGPSAGELFMNVYENNVI